MEFNKNDIVTYNFESLKNMYVVLRKNRSMGDYRYDIKNLKTKDIYTNVYMTKIFFRKLPQKELRTLKFKKIIKDN